MMHNISCIGITTKNRHTDIILPKRYLDFTITSYILYCTGTHSTYKIEGEINSIRNCILLHDNG